MRIARNRCGRLHMTTFYIIIGIVVVTAIVIAVARSGLANVEAKNKYHYSRKSFFLTRAEHDCYDALVEAVGAEYRIFAQVHLSNLVDHEVRGQDWHAALAHINRKSVDFVLCDKAFLSPKLAIELDDKSHERPDRQERDLEVERILSAAGMPLLRLENHGSFHPGELSQRIKEALTTRTASL